MRIRAGLEPHPSGRGDRYQGGGNDDHDHADAQLEERYAPEPLRAHLITESRPDPKEVIGAGREDKREDGEFNEQYAPVVRRPEPGNGAHMLPRGKDTRHDDTSGEDQRGGGESVYQRGHSRPPSILPQSPGSRKSNH